MYYTRVVGCVILIILQIIEIILCAYLCKIHIHVMEIVNLICGIGTFGIEFWDKI